MNGSLKGHQRLVGTLAANITDPGSIKRILGATGVPLGQVNLRDPPFDIWWDAVEVASEMGRLDKLVEEAKKEPSEYNPDWEGLLARLESEKHGARRVSSSRPAPRDSQNKPDKQAVDPRVATALDECVSLSRETMLLCGKLYEHSRSDSDIPDFEWRLTEIQEKLDGIEHEYGACQLSAEARTHVAAAIEQARDSAQEASAAAREQIAPHLQDMHRQSNIIVRLVTRARQDHWIWESGVTEVERLLALVVKIHTAWDKIWEFIMFKRDDWDTASWNVLLNFYMGCGKLEASQFRSPALGGDGPSLKQDVRALDTTASEFLKALEGEEPQLVRDLSKQAVDAMNKIRAKLTNVHQGLIDSHRYRRTA